VREYHAKHDGAAEGSGGMAVDSTTNAAAAADDGAAMDIDESSRQKILALTQGSKRRKIRHGNPQADGYDLHSLLLTEMAKVRGGDLYSPQEVFGRYLDLTDVHDGLAAVGGSGGGAGGAGSATLRGELAKAATAAASGSTASASKPSASSADAAEEKKDDDSDKGSAAGAAFPYVDFLSLLTQALDTVLPESTKLHNRKPYVRFLSALYDYLLGFLRRTMPLLDAEGVVIRPALDEFESTWGETGGYPGWESRDAEKVLASSGATGAADSPSSSSTNAGTTIDLASYANPQKLCDAIDADMLKAELSRIGLKCGGAPLDRAKRLFLLKDTALSDLPKKVWAKGRSPPPAATSADGETKPEGAADGSDGDVQAISVPASPALTSSSLAGSSRRIDVARLEVATQALLDQLRPTLDATVRRAERRLYQTPNERDVELDEEINGIAGVRGKKPKEGKEKGDGEEGDSDEDSDDEDAPIYNPKGVPLGWDGKPIPYWLFKLHGLNHFYSCEICGNESYRGRHNFEKHFQESKHVYGMRCLGIPNTRHFHGVTKIEDAQHLWSKLQHTVEDNVFDGEKEEEYEDSHGNVLTRKTYQDLARQGLL
jgi:splicing factor 3A subunit 3